MKMSANLSLLFSIFLFIHTCNAFDITQILNKYPDFSTFNSYLTQYNLATTINGRQTITLLVVDNGSLSPISSYPPDVIKNILSVHLILDYYDLTKLQQLASGSSLLPTLFQASGLAKGQQGFLNVTHATAGSVTFSSAMPGSTQGASLVKLVVSEPYNISILQISTAIIPQGIDGTKTSSPPSKSPSTPLATPPPAPATATPPPPAPATATPPPPAPATATPPPPAPATATPPPPAPATATPPPPAPATATAPSKSSMAPPPTPATTTPPQSSMAPPPTTSKGTAPSSSPPSAAQAPSAAPGSATEPGTLAPESPTKDEPAGDKPTFKSAAATVETGLALVCTMAFSTLYLGSRI